MGQAAWLSVQLLLGFADCLGEILAAVVDVIHHNSVPSAHLLCILPMLVAFEPVLNASLVQLFVDVHRITSAPTTKAASKVSIMAVDSFILFPVF